MLRFVGLVVSQCLLCRHALSLVNRFLVPFFTLFAFEKRERKEEEIDGIYIFVECSGVDVMIGLSLRPPPIILSNRLDSKSFFEMNPSVQTTTGTIEQTTKTQHRPLVHYS
jgi:hypothetical protein